MSELDVRPVLLSAPDARALKGLAALLERKHFKREATRVQAIADAWDHNAHLATVDRTTLLSTVGEPVGAESSA